MPRSKLKGRDFLKVFLNIGATAVEEHSRSKQAKIKQAEDDAALKVFTDFFGEREANPLNTPLGLPQNMGIVQEFPQVQAVQDAQLLNRYRMLDIPAPSWLQARTKRLTTPPKVLTPAEREFKDLTLRGKRATVTSSERIARGEMSPAEVRAEQRRVAAATDKRKKARATQQRKAQEQLVTDQKAWDKKVNSYTAKHIDQFPMFEQLEKEMAEGKFRGVQNRIINSWPMQDLLKYFQEKIRLTNIHGMRPTKPIQSIRPSIVTKPEDPVVKKLRDKGYSEAEIQEAMR